MQTDHKEEIDKIMKKLRLFFNFLIDSNSADADFAVNALETLDFDYKKNNLSIMRRWMRETEKFIRELDPLLRDSFERILVKEMNEDLKYLFDKQEMKVDRILKKKQDINEKEYLILKEFMNESFYRLSKERAEEITRKMNTYSRGQLL